MKLLLVSFSDNADHQDTLFGLYEQLTLRNENTWLLAARAPKVPLKKNSHTWLVDCPRKPGIEKKTFDLITLFSMIRRVKKENFDVVYFESLHVWNLALMAFLGRKVRKYQVIHEVIPHEGDQQAGGVDLMNRVVCRTADIIVLRNQKYLPVMTERYQIDKTRVKFLELWRRYPEFTEPSRSGRFLYFGRMNPYKGADNLLEIVRLCPEIRFDVIGRVDPSMESVAGCLEKEKNVVLKNAYVSDEEMREAFVRCDWVIVPYKSASQSGIIIDAYKYSRPVIAFEVGAIAEQIDDGKSGFLIEAGRNDLFAGAIKKAAAMSADEYHAMCSYAWQYGYNKYSALRAADRFLQLLQETGN